MSPYGKYDDIGHIERLYYNKEIDEKVEIISPFPHITKQMLFKDLEPFDGLVYKPSIDIAEKYIKIKDIGWDIKIIEK